MNKKQKTSLSAKFLAIRHYLNEVPVEGQATDPTQRRLGNYDKYLSQVIRAGNCITLLRESYPMDVSSFWNINHFEKFVKSVFWTFNDSFLLKLLDNLEIQKPLVLHRSRELLLKHPAAYAEPMPDDADDELRVCYLKNSNLKKDEKYASMYTLDQKNREAILEAVEKKIAGLTPPLSMDAAPVIKEPAPAPDFLTLLRPIDGNTENTLEFIIQHATRAGFAFPFRTKVQKTKKDTNPYKFNGQIAAVIDYFQELDYIYKEYDFVVVLEAYLRYSGNDIPKFRQVVTGRWHDGSYQELLAALKELQISKHI